MHHLETPTGSITSRPVATRASLRLLTGALIAFITISSTACGAPAAPTTAPTAASKAPTAATATVQTTPQGAAQTLPPGGPPGGPGGPPKVITPTLQNVAYAATSSAQVLDLYIPAGSGPFPLVINIHAGGFFSGDKDMAPGSTSKALLAAGYAIASIGYRLSGEAKFPAAVYDAKAAVRFLRANAAKYNLNPDKFAAFGQSAGGNIAALLGTSGGIAAMEGDQGNNGVSSKVQAVVDWYGPVDFGVMDAQIATQTCPAGTQLHTPADSFESQYLGAALNTLPDVVKKANPITYISADTPPFFIQNGDQDCNVPVAQSKMLADALTAARLDAHYELLKGVGHGDDFTGAPVFEAPANIQQVVAFLNAKLTVAAPAASAAIATTAPSAPAATTAPTTTQRSPGGSGQMTSGASATPTYKDLAYASVSAVQKLDIYLPQGDGPFPLIINLHGGGFMMGDKNDPPSQPAIAQFLAAGYAVASIGYRLSAEAKAPAQIQDVKAAVRFLRANAAKHKLNPEKFASFGGSAGGSLAALLGTSCGAAGIEGADLGNGDQSSCVQAVVDWFGPTDFLQMDAQFAGTACPQDHNAANSPESQLVGAPIQTKPDLVKLVNPITYISPKAPPFLIQHGTADCNVPPQQGKILADALIPAIGADKVTYTLLQGAGHGDAAFSAAANMKIVLDFLGKYLK